MRFLDFSFPQGSTRMLRSGTFLSSIFADSGEFQELRDYVPGESVKRMDWVRSVGREVPVVRSFNEEVDHALVLVLDISPSFRFSDRRGSKVSLLFEACTLLIRSAWVKGMGGSIYGLSDFPLPIPRNESWLITLRDKIMERAYGEAKATEVVPKRLMSMRDAFVIGLTDRSGEMAKGLTALLRKNVCMVASVVHPGEREINREFDAGFTDSSQVVRSRASEVVFREDPYLLDQVACAEILVSKDPFRPLQSLITFAWRT